MGEFRNGELATSFIELSVNFRDFALHYESPPSDRLSVPWIKGSFAQARWSFALDLIEILVDHDGAWRFNGCKISWIQSAATPSECVESSTARSRELRGSRRSTVVMESRALVDRHGVTENTVSLATESMVDSPLRNLPIRQVMGDAHYLSQS